MVVINLGTFAFVVSLVTFLLCVVALVPVYAKVFFSTHAVEFRPIEEIAKIRQSMGMEPKTHEEQVEEELEHGTALADADELWGEEPKELTDFLAIAKDQARMKQQVQELRRKAKGGGE